MKSKLLPLLLFLLIFLNGVLIFILIKKPHENISNRPKRNFLTEQLQFSKSQNKKFNELEKEHRSFMIHADHSIREHKDVLYNSFDSSLNIDSVANLIGILEGKKEKEVFRFFSEVRKLCLKEQTKKFDKIINEALKNRKKRPPRERRMPPPDERIHSSAK